MFIKENVQSKCISGKFKFYVTNMILNKYIVETDRVKKKWKTSIMVDFHLIQ